MESLKNVTLKLFFYVFYLDLMKMIALLDCPFHWTWTRFYRFLQGKNTLTVIFVGCWLTSWCPRIYDNLFDSCRVERKQKRRGGE